MASRGGIWTYTWEHGRELASMTKGNTTWNFTYDANGMRTSRTNGTTTYSYVYNGGQLSQMKVGETTLNFTYDAAGIPLSVTYGDATYYYVTDLQGDVVAIVDTNKEIVVEYLYDAWGRLLTTGGSKAADLGLHNPLRYRGYVYDPETGLYYLQSRYYNPELGRFINGDALTSTGQGLLGNNMFAYCGNNPVSRNDTSGNLWETVLAGALVGALSSFVGSIVSDVVKAVIDNEPIAIDVDGAFISAGFGALSGAAAVLNPAAAPIINSLFSATEAVVDGARNKLDTGEFLINIAVSAGLGAVTGSWGSDFANTSLIDDGLKAVSKMVSGNHPGVKGAAWKVARQAGKLLLNALGGSLIEDPAIAILETGTQWYLTEVLT